MSKAEEKSLKAYPKKIEWVGNQWDGAPFDINSESRAAYKQGYYQAEKDLGLTWEDISKIISIDQQICGTMGISDYTHNHQQAMEEVLKLFNNQRRK